MIFDSLLFKEELVQVLSHFVSVLLLVVQVALDSVLEVEGVESEGVKLLRLEMGDLTSTLQVVLNAGQVVGNIP